MKRTFSACVSGSLLLVALGHSVPASADGETCVPVQGAATSNAIDGQTTFGVMSMVVGQANDPVVLRCALRGSSQYAEFPTLKSVQLVSCDDADWELKGQPIHSQLTFDAHGTVMGGDSALFALYEKSFPRAGTGTGWFYGVKSGELRMTGALYPETGAVDMTFDGEFCF